MKVSAILRAKRDELVSLWINAVFATYPEKSAAVLKTNRDPFTNPMADMIREAAGYLLTALAEEEVRVDDVKTSLDRFVKIRAVQKEAPSESLGVICLIKPILREHVLPETAQSDLPEYLELESRVDTLLLLAFDLYTEDRETLANIRVKEIRNQYAQLKRWAQQIDAGAPLGTFVGCGNGGCK